MDKVICMKGHFFNGDKYETCPHCAAGMEAIRPDPFLIRHSQLEEEGRQGKKKRVFSLSRGRQQLTAVYIQKEASAGQTVLLQKNEDVEKPQQNSDYVPTEKIYRSSSSPSDAPALETDEDEKTVGYFSIGRMEPPVGYLICTAGDDYGRGFPLKTGNNSIGRSVNMDIAVMDDKVSREKQAFIMYEPFKREFYMKPGEGTGLCYLNGELVLAPAKMEAFDLILVGDTQLMLVPVCCEKFSWDAG